MKYLKIENKGELDMRLITLMGGSTKSDDKSKIGEFGTGLKYSIAYLMRNNIDLKIFIGEQEVTFGTEQETIQDTSFDIITIDSKRTELTTAVGKDWKGWMICREIWCNAIDEEEYSKDVTEELVGRDGYTTFYLQLTGEIKETVDNWTDYFTDKPRLAGSDHNGYILHGGGHIRLYKQGVLVYEDKEKPSLYCYDFPFCSINELREYKGWMPSEVERCLANLDKKYAEHFISNVKDEHWEGGLDFNYVNFSKEWITMLGDAKIIKQEDLTSFKSRGVEIDEASLVVVPDGIYNQLSDMQPSVSAVRRADKVNSFVEVYDQEMEEAINRAKDILEECGYWVDPELKWLVGHFGSGNKLGSVNLDTKEVMMSMQLKSMGEFEMVTTVIEENEHARTGYSDCSREFQQHFINLYAKTLLKSGGKTV